MFNNPYNFNNFRQNEQQQPIQNIFTSQLPSQDLFMARYLKENEKIEDIFVNNKTAFIDLKNKQLSIKELDGRIERYGLILPKDDKDILIENLQAQINELKGMIINEQSNTNVTTSDEITKSDGDVKKSNRK